MRIGTKSLLFGGHCFLIHPWFVALGWWKLYGFPWNIRLWVAFFVHDLGYWGKPNMDGPEGESHPELGYDIMAQLFGYEWGDFTLYHSRYYSKRAGSNPSRLCFADKLAMALTPDWIFVPMARLTGEIREYRSEERMPSKNWTPPHGDDWEWHRAVQEFARAYVAKHRDDPVDTWTRV